MTKTTNETVILVTGATGTVGSEVIKQFTLPSLSIMDNIIIIEIPIVSSLNVLIYFCMSCSYQHRRNLASLSVIGRHFGSGNLNI